MNTLNVHFLPELVAADELAGSTCVVIDVLRASTTIVYALAAGARAVIPCLTIEDARRRAEQFPRGDVLLAGERRGLPIAGFDLGNSPDEFTPHLVGGKTIVLSTTNGTKALVHSRAADEILVGAFANLSAVCAALARRPRVEVLCAGTDGKVTEEDLLVAGAVVEQLAASGEWKLADTAARVRNGWRSVLADAMGRERDTRIAAAMREVAGGPIGDEPGGGERERRIAAAMSIAPGGRNLVRIGMSRDIETAAEIDRFDIVPRFDPASGKIQCEES